MNENLPSNVQLDANGNGTVIFATDVIATIAGLAATEVEGVASMSGSTSGGGLADIFTRKSQSSRSLTRGVRVELGENNSVNINLTIIADYGTPIPEVAGNIQENVKKAIETMSGLKVTSVNVHVQGVSFEREMRAAAEIEQKQRLMLKEDEARSSEAEARPEADAKPETEVKPEAEVKPETDARPEAEVKPETDARPEAEVKPEAELKPEADASPENEATPEDEGEYELDLGDDEDAEASDAPAEEEKADSAAQDGELNENQAD